MTRRSNFFKSNFFITTKAVALVVIPLTLLILPKTFFDEGHSICLFTLLTGDECYGCGMTRACMHMIHLDFAGAAKFNRIAFIVLPILCFLYLRELIETMEKFSFYTRYLSKTK